MNHVVGGMHDEWQLCNVVTPITLLLDTGAEFAKIPISQGHSYIQPSLPLYMTKLANAAEIIDCKVESVRLFSLC